MAWRLRHTNTTHIRAWRLTLLSQWETGRESVYQGLWDYHWANYHWSSRRSLADCVLLAGTEDSLSLGFKKDGRNEGQMTILHFDVTYVFLMAHYWFFHFPFWYYTPPLSLWSIFCVFCLRVVAHAERGREHYSQEDSSHFQPWVTFPPAAPMTLHTRLLHGYGLYYFLALLTLFMSEGRCVFMFVSVT